MAAQPYKPEIMALNNGETTSYTVYFKWGILMPRAGEAVLSFKATSGGAADYSLRFATSKFFDAIYKMRDTLTCRYSADCELIYALKLADEGDYFLTDELEFSYFGNRTNIHSHRYTPKVTKIDTTLTSTSGYVFDMLGIIFYIRTLDYSKLKPDDRRTVQVAIGRDLVKVGCTYYGTDVTDCNKIKYRTRHFGIDVYDETFEQTKSATEIWIGDDANHLPVKIRSKLKFGAAEIYFKSAENLKTNLSCIIN